MKPTCRILKSLSLFAVLSLLTSVLAVTSEAIGGNEAAEGSHIKAPPAISRAPSTTSPDNHNYQAFWDLNTKSDYTCDGTVAGSGKGRLLQQNGSWQIVSPAPRYYHTIIWYPAQKCLIIFGGNTIGDMLLNETWFYYPFNDTWVQKAPGPTRIFHSAVWDPEDSEMLVFGGWDGKMIQNELWAYRPDEDTWSTKASGATARGNHSAAWDTQNSQMLVFGGLLNGSRLGDLWAYKPSTDSWSQLKSGATPRYRHAAAWDSDNNQMLVHAGYAGGPSPYYGMDLWAYYPSNDTWVRKADSGINMVPMHAAYDTCQKRMLLRWGNTYSYSPSTNTWTNLNIPGPNSSGMLAWDPVEAKMYTHAAEATNVWVFTSSQNSWQTKAPDLPYFYHCSVWDDDQNKMLVFGGSTGAMGPHAYQVLAYDPATCAWTRSGDCPDEFEHVRAVWDPTGKRAYFTGVGSSNRVCNRTWMYDPVNDTWTRRADLPVPHYGLTVVWDTQRGQMIVFGGADFWNSAYWEGVYIYHPDTDKWEWKMQSPAPHGRVAHSASWDEANDRMIIAGGSYYDGSTTRYLKDTWSYDPVTNTWNQLTDLPGNRVASVSAWDSTHDLMLVLGGNDENSQPVDDLYFDPCANGWTCLTYFLPWSPFFTVVWDRQDNQLLAWGGWGEFGGKALRAYSMPFVQNGTITAKAFLLSNNLVRIYRIYYNSTLPSGTGLRFQFATSSDNLAWGPWQDFSNGTIPQQQEKYVSWRALLNTSKPLFSPSIDAVRIEYLTNRLPSVIVSNPLTSKRNAEVSLRGVAFDGDRDPLTYSWTQTAGPPVTLHNDRFPNASFTPALPGNYSFSLVVFDGYAYSPPGNATVEVLNQAPEVTAAACATAHRNETVRLLGSGTDPEDDPIMFCWTQTDGPDTTIDGQCRQNASFTPEKLGDYTFTLTASDMYGGLSMAEITIRILNRAPTATIMNDTVAHVRSPVLVRAAAVDNDNDTLDYMWKLRSGGAIERQTADGPLLEFVPLDPVVYSFQLLVTDGIDFSTPVTVNVSVINRLPEISVGSDLTGAVNTTIRLSATVNDPDGDPLTCRWSQLDGPPVSIENADTANASFLARRTGLYSFVLTVFDTHINVTAFLNVTVIKPHVPFSFTSTPPLSGTAGRTLSYNVSIDDPDAGRTIRVTLERAPDGMSLAGLQLTWTPATNQTGFHDVSLKATDGISAVYQNWTINIGPAPRDGNGGPSSSSPSGLSWLGSAVVVAMILASMVMAVVLKLRRRRSS